MIISLFFILTLFFQEFLAATTADYHIHDGNKLLTINKYEDALASFNYALEYKKQHPSALIGRAIALLHQEKYIVAEKQLTLIINLLTRKSNPISKSETNTLSSAFANRGIIKDRKRKYKEALDDYIVALRIETNVNDFDKISLERYPPSTIRNRAIYLKKQIEKPPGMRSLKIPRITYNKQ
jgi:tetratricopeptide (TPR) repeat protein